MTGTFKYYAIVSVSVMDTAGKATRLDLEGLVTSIDAQTAIQQALFSATLHAKKEANHD